MASPAKAFIDPTYLSRMVPGNAMTGVVCPPLRTFRTDATGLIIQQMAEANRIPMVTGMPAVVPFSFFAHVPTPPMGRLAILTFPPIYKERQGPTIGQIYPPPVF